MPGKCPLCGQSLPHALDHNELQSRILKLSSPVLTAERKKLKEDYDVRLEAAVDRNRQIAERQLQRQVREVEQRARIDAQREVKKRQLDAEIRIKKEMAQSLRIAELQNEAKLDKLQSERERDRVRHATELARNQKIVEDLSRKLEKQSGEQLGAEAERDLLAELRAAFPGDHIKPIGRGVKGADILHEVIENAKVVGRIVFESKNTSDWSKNFIAQAKKYRTQYETPNVIIVARVLPKKQKGFCIEKGIPIVTPSMAVALSAVMREGIIAIATLRLSGNAHDEKSVELYQYIVGDKFCTRFRELAEGVESLRLQQQNERRWHENAWEAETKIHEQIASRHREVEAHISAICGGSYSSPIVKLPARSEMRPGADSVRKFKRV